MQSEVREYNRLEGNTARRVADRLKDLFYSPSDHSPPIPPDSNLGSMPLLESLEDVPINSIPFSKDSFNIYAIDGGSSVLARGGNIEIIAWRAGRVHFYGRKRIAEECPPPEILAYNRLQATEIMHEATMSLPVKYVSERPSLRPVDDLRWLREWGLLGRAVDESEENSLILIDGSLRSNPVFDTDYQRGILKQAAEKNVHVMAVTKQSTIAVGGAIPIDITSGHSIPRSDTLWYRRISRSLEASPGWLGHIYQVSLHPAADKIYRVDLNRFDHEDEKTLFSMLAAVSDDIEFAGYPYPLAAAHRLARIDGHFREEMIDRLGQTLEEKEFSVKLWEYLIRDIHDKLNADLIAQTGSA
jgi:hypothetical protein